MRFGSLFSGIGGFDLAFENAGMSCAWQCEIDQKASAVLANHWPEVKRYEDVRTITRENTEPVDLICGGFPCQDLSVAGKRKGLAGERSGLWFEFHRILSELKPQWVVVENVPGLLSANRGRDFAVLLSGLADIGYLSAWRVLDAQFFGVAQRRRRVFIVGSLGDGRAAEVLFEREGVRWNPPPRRNKKEGVAGSVEAVAFENHPNDSRITETGDISQQLTSRMGTGGGNVPLVMAHGQSNAEIVSDGEPSLTVNHEQPILVWEQYRAEDGNYRVGDARQVAHPTLRSNKLNFAPLVNTRRLTPTECERLQGFPDGWTAGQSDSARYKQLGNAVAVPVAEWIGWRIIEAHNDPRP
ncbi:MAG: DNA cytosine methyltransferase [Saccharofermentanales bacterium]